MNARARGFPFPRERERDSREHERGEPQPCGRTKERAGCDQRLRQERQRLPALLIHRHDLRYDIGDEDGDHAERNDRHERRIDQRHREFLPQREARIEIIGKPGQHFGQAAGLGARADEPAIERREGARKARQRSGQRFAGRAHATAIAVTTFATRASSACSATATSAWSSGIPDCTSVASCRVTSASAAAGKTRARQRMAPLRRDIDGSRREAVGAQAIARGARIVGVEQALAQAALRIDGFEPECAQ